MAQDVERRTTRRQRVLKAGTISFDRAAAISCSVRNISDGGACLEVASPIGIPPQFDLYIEKDQTSRTCLVIWRSANRIGVAFR
jgi:hypothetical protein